MNPEQEITLIKTMIQNGITDEVIRKTVKNPELLDVVRKSAESKTNGHATAAEHIAAAVDPLDDLFANTEFTSTPDPIVSSQTGTNAEALPVTEIQESPQAEEPQVQEIPKNLKQYAVDALSRGFFIFALQSDSKFPVRGSHGFKDSTNSPDVLTRWDLRPDSNIGIDCGKSGLTVADFERVEDVPTWVNEIATLKIKSRAGLHVYFSGVRDGSEAMYIDGKKVGDLQSTADYVLFNGSYHPSGAIYQIVEDSPIAPVPARIEELLVKPGQEDKPETQRVRAQLVPGTLRFERVVVPPDPAFNKLFEVVGWEPLENRLNKMEDTRFHGIELKPGKLSFCPMPQHQPRGVDVPYKARTFGVIAGQDAEHLVHCFGCGFSGDLVKTVKEFDQGDEGGKIVHATMYDCARYICRESQLDPEQFFPSKRKITVTSVTESEEDGMPVEVDTVNMTETGNARRVIAANGQNIRYVARWDDFLVYDKERGLWIIDEYNHQVERFMKRMTKQMLRETKEKLIALKQAAAVIEAQMEDDYAPNEAEQKVLADYDEAKRLYKWSIASESNRTIKGSISLIKSEENMSIQAEDLNKNRWLANVQNGSLIFNPDDGSVIFRNHLRSDYCDRVMPTVYEAGAQCPIFLNFMSQIMQGRQDYIDFLQEYFGFCLTGNVIRMILILYGQGLDGKGALMRTIAKVLGETREGYAMEANIKTFMTYKETAQGSPRPDILALEEPRLVTAFETNKGEQHVWDMGMMKKITGGDALRARGMHSGDEYQFRPKCKIVLGLNHLPKINDPSKAARDRIAVVKCLMALKPGEVDLTLEPRMLGEASGILNWMIEGLQRALARKAEGGPLIMIPNGVLHDSQEYTDSENPIVIFAQENLVKEEGAEVSTAAVHEAYNVWAAKHDHQQVSIEVLIPYLTDRLAFEKGRTRTEDGQIRVLKGVRLAQQEEELTLN